MYRRPVAVHVKPRARKVTHTYPHKHPQRHTCRYTCMQIDTYVYVQMCMSATEETLGRRRKNRGSWRSGIERGSRRRRRRNYGLHPSLRFFAVTFHTSHSRSRVSSADSNISLRHGEGSFSLSLSRLLSRSVWVGRTGEAGERKKMLLWSALPPAPLTSQAKTTARSAAACPA